MFASRSSSTAACVTGGVAAASNADGLGPGAVRRGLGTRDMYMSVGREHRICLMRSHCECMHCSFHILGSASLKGIRRISLIHFFGEWMQCHVCVQEFKHGCRCDRWSSRSQQPRRVGARRSEALGQCQWHRLWRCDCCPSMACSLARRCPREASRRMYVCAEAVSVSHDYNVFVRNLLVPVMIIM